MPLKIQTDSLPKREWLWGYLRLIRAPQGNFNLQSRKACGSPLWLRALPSPELQWQKLAVQWNSKATAEHATRMAIVEEG